MMAVFRWWSQPVFAIVVADLRPFSAQIPTYRHQSVHEDHDNPWHHPTWHRKWSRFEMQVLNSSKSGSLDGHLPFTLILVVITTIFVLIATTRYIHALRVWAVEHGQQADQQSEEEERESHFGLKRRLFHQNDFRLKENGWSVELVDRKTSTGCKAEDASLFMRILLGNKSDCDMEKLVPLRSSSCLGSRSFGNSTLSVKLVVAQILPSKLLNSERRTTGCFGKRRSWLFWNESFRIPIIIVD